MSRPLTERTPRRARRRGVGLALAVPLTMLLSGCSQEQTDQMKRLGLPALTSDRAPYMENLWVNAWIAAGVVGFFVWGLIGWTALRYRRRSEEYVPPQVRYNLPIEVLYTIAPIIVVSVLFFFTVETQNKILDEVPNPEHQVQVTAQQWSWTFSYLAEDALGGSTDVYDLGTPASESELWLVEDKTVTFTLHSPDVIHSFWVPSWAFKLDVIPGHDQSFSLTPDTIGTYVGRCAELCGVSHSRMLFSVVVVDQATFDQHLQDLKDAGQIGAPPGASNSEDVSGLDDQEGTSS